MYLFEKGETTASFRATSDVIKRNIDGLSNEEICGTDLDELEEYYLSKNQIEEIEIFKDNITKELSETKVKEYNHFYRRGYEEFEPEYYSLDGFQVIFTIPFDGDVNLLYLRPSSYYMSRFEVDNVISPTETEYGKIIISFKFKKRELQESEDSNEYVQQKFNQEIRTYYEMIDRVNQEVQNYNANLPAMIKQY